MKFKHGDILVDMQGEVYEVINEQKLQNTWIVLLSEFYKKHENDYMADCYKPVIRLKQYINESFKKIGVL